jgi:phosphate:Na+ symporter
MSLWTVANFAGGIGLFLLGMKLMSDGLRFAAGETLRDILAGWTASPLRGVLAGVLITAMVQSSSAVIFAVIGFVNAGLLTLAQAIGVIYGSNVGTTITSWLVALIGFNVDLKLLSMPAIALGMLLRITGGGTRRGSLGEAVAGFGVFFLGIDVLKATFAGMEQTLHLESMLMTGGAGLLGLTGIGVLLTVAMQSSSAALAVTLTAAASGLVPLEAAAAVVIGANIGTTSTAAFAALGATPSAKRAASAHVLFNLLTGAAALVLLPLLLGLVVWIELLLGLGSAPATSLAIFHTATKLLGLVLLWPLTGLLVRFLEARFRTAEEDEGRARHLDGNVLGTPALALAALDLELRRISAVARRAAKDALSAEGAPGGRFTEERRIVDQLVDAVGDFTNRVQQAALPRDLSDAFPQALRISQYLGDIAERAEVLGAMQAGLAPIGEADLAGAVAHFKAAAVQLLDATDPAVAGFSAAASQQALQGVQEDYQVLKARLLRAGTEGRLHIRQMVARLDEISVIRRVLDQAVKAAVYHERLGRIIHGAKAENPTEADPAVAP